MEFKNFNEWARYYVPQFRRVFGFNLPYDFHGIDMVKLEGILNPSEDSSVREMIEQRWGNKGIDLFDELSFNPPPFPK